MGVPDLQYLEVVYRSARTLIERGRVDGEPVVVKSSAAELPSSSEIDTLRRERVWTELLAGPGVPALLPVESVGAKYALVFRDEGYAAMPRSALPLRRMLDLAQKVVRVVARIHGAGVVHGDLNPSNLLLRAGDSHVEVIDFGVSHVPLDAAGAAARGLVGTVEYIAPEQTGRIARGIDFRADLYALGATFYEWLVGRPPFDEVDAAGYVHAHLSKEPPPMPRVPAVLAEIVHRLLAKDPDNRYQTADALLHDLEMCGCRMQAGKIEVFEIGSTDRVARLDVANVLVERGDALSRICEGKGGLFFVSGPTGSGKSALLLGAHRALSDRGRQAILTAPRERDATVPLSTIALVLDAVTDEIALGPCLDSERRRRDLADAVHPNGSVLTEMQPRLLPVLGTQPAVAELGAQESDQRRVAVLESFFEAVGGLAGLVILVDQAEHVDAASARLLNALAEREGARVRIVAAVEALESGGHLARVAPVVEHLALGPLGPAGVERIVSTTLGSAAGPLVPLVEVVLAKTGGNPLLVGEFLRQAYDERHLFQTARGYAWDEAALWRTQSSSDVVEQTLSRLDRLTPEDLGVLGIAASIGHEIDAAQLERLSPETDIDATLFRAARARVVLPVVNGTSAFAHPRIRERLRAELTAAKHLEIARDMQRQLAASDDPGWFAVAEQLHQARQALATPEERETSIDVQVRVARMARNAGANALAAEQLARAVELSSVEPAAISRRACFELRRAHTECVRLAGDTARAHGLAEALVDSASTPVERAVAHRLRALSLLQRGRMDDAILAIHTGLHQLDIALPTRGEDMECAIGAGLEAMMATFARVPPRALAALPIVTEPRVVEAMALLTELIPAAFQFCQPLFVLAELKMLELTSAHGVTATSSKNLIDMGLIVVKTFDDLPLALELTDASFQLLERFAPTPLACGVKFVYGAFTAQWRETPAALRAVLEDAHRIGALLGDTDHSTFAAVWTGMAKRVFGHPLDEVRAAAIAARDYSRAVGSRIGEVLAEQDIRFVETLLGTAAPIEPAEIEKLGAMGDNAVLYAAQCELLRAYLMDDVEAAQRSFEILGPLEEVANATFAHSNFLMLRSLHAADVLERMRPDARVTDEPARLHAIIARAEKQLRERAAANPAMFTGPYQLVLAERLRLDDAPATAVAAAYDAVADLTGAPWLPVRAIACERQAGYWAARGRQRLARPLIREAHSLYERWGATAKCELLEAEHPSDVGAPGVGGIGTLGFTNTGRRSSTGAEKSVDVTTIIKALTAISSEVKVERLYAALMSVILENAGAQFGCLVHRESDVATVEARARVEEPVTVAHTPLALSDDVAKTIIRHVLRTGEDVTLDNALEHPQHGSDPHVVAARVRSLLCIAIRHGGEIHGALYVENNTVTGAFTPRHVELLRIIAGQADISLQNARIYALLEDKVEERTRELASRSREILALLDNVPQGIFTFGPDMAVEERHSAALASVLGTDKLVGRDVMTLLFDGSDVSSEERRLTQMVLQCSFGLDDFMARINWEKLSRFSCTQQATGPRMLEVDWAPILDEEGNVSRILASVRDVSAVRALQAKLATASREAETLDQALEAGLDVFDRVCADANERLERARSALSADCLSRQSVEAVFGHLHTLKGTARVVGLKRLASLFHEAEEPFAALRGDDGPIEPGPLRAALVRLREEVDLAHALVERRLGVLVRAKGRADQIARVALDEVGRHEREGIDARECLDRIAAAIRPPIPEVPRVATLVRAMEKVVLSVASELGKPVPALALDGDAPLEARRSAALADALEHILRNAVDHGIETSTERRAAQKLERATIRIEVRESASSLRITVHDDGRGLDLGTLRDRLGPGLSDELLAERIFDSGVSTAATLTEISGRGVGMSAVRNALREVGGSITVLFTGPERLGRRPFDLVIALPPHEVTQAA